MTIATDAIATRAGPEASQAGSAARPRRAAILARRLAGADALSRSWARLDAQASLPMQGKPFNLALAGTLLADTHVEVFDVRDSDGLAAVLPLCRERGYLARWRMLGAREVFEPGDALCAGTQAARALAQAIVADGRPVSLDRVPAESMLVGALGAATRGKGWLAVRPATPCPVIALDQGWMEPESRFNAGRRSDFRRAARRAHEFGTVGFELLAPSPAEFDSLFDEAIGVELCSWKDDAGSAIAADPRKEEFFRTFFRLAAEEGSCRIAFMRIDGRAVAMQLALEWQGRYWLFKIGHDEAYAKASPGTLLMLETLRRAAAGKLVAYEFLGDVEPWIVRFWTREERACVTLRTYPRSLRGAAALAADAAVWLGQRLSRRAR